MPTHETASAEASALKQLVAELEQHGEEIITVVAAGPGFMAITKPKKSARPKATR